MSKGEAPEQYEVCWIERLRRWRVTSGWIVRHHKTVAEGIEWHRAYERGAGR